MSKVLITDTTMTGIANAIRYKLGTSDTLLPSEMPSAIRSIQGEGELIGVDFGTIGYEELPSDIKAKYDDLDYSQEVFDNWDVETTTAINMFKNNTDLVYFPLIDTSNVRDADGFARNCTNLVSVPALDLTGCDASGSMGAFQSFGWCTNLRDVDVIKIPVKSCRIFCGCPNLTDESLNNLLLSCMEITERVSSSQRNLKYIMGINYYNDDYETARLEALPSYQDFIDAGWTLE